MQGWDTGNRMYQNGLDWEAKKITKIAAIRQQKEDTIVEACPFVPVMSKNRSDRILRKRSYERSTEKLEVRLIR